MRSATMPGPWPRLILATTALAGLALASFDVLADATILVTAHVDDACELVSTEINIDFGVYENAEIRRTPSFAYACTAGRNLTFNLLPLPISGNTRGLVNVINSGSPLFYELFDPDGQEWVSSYSKTSVNGGESLEFEAVLAGGQLGDVNPGDFEDQLTLTMSVGP